MATPPTPARLYLITDRAAAAPRALPEVVATALDALPPGAAWVQLREKDLDGRALVELARALAKVVHARGGRLLINDRVDVAHAAGADGVHLPETGFDPATVRALAPELLIGVSLHGGAPRPGADFAVLGPIWATPSKARYGEPLGTRALAEVDAPYPVLALGGIDSPQRAGEARAAGAHGVACIRAVMAADDPGAAARALYEAVR